jgi:hypothetical protein
MQGTSTGLSPVPGWLQELQARTHAGLPAALNMYQHHVDCFGGCEPASATDAETVAPAGAQDGADRFEIIELLGEFVSTHNPNSQFLRFPGCAHSSRSLLMQRHP